MGLFFSTSRLVSSNGSNQAAIQRRHRANNRSNIDSSPKTERDLRRHMVRSQTKMACPYVFWQVDGTKKTPERRVCAMDITLRAWSFKCFVWYKADFDKEAIVRRLTTQFPRHTLRISPFHATILRDSSCFITASESGTENGYPTQLITVPSVNKTASPSDRTVLAM